MTRTTEEIKYIVYDPITQFAISCYNKYMSTDPANWYIYPSEKAAKAAKTSCMNDWKYEYNRFKSYPDCDHYKEAEKFIYICKTLEVKPYKITTIYEL